MGRGKRQADFLSADGRTRRLPTLAPPPPAPTNVRVLTEWVPFAALESADETCRQELLDLGLEPAATRYRLLRLKAHELAQATCQLTDYLRDGDQDGYEKARAIYTHLSGFGHLPPPIICYGDDYARRRGYDSSLGRWVILDGYHRLAAYGEMREETIDVYQLLLD